MGILIPENYRKPGRCGSWPHVIIRAEPTREELRLVVGLKQLRCICFWFVSQHRFHRITVTNRGGEALTSIVANDDDYNVNRPQKRRNKD